MSAKLCPGCGAETAPAPAPVDGVLPFIAALTAKLEVWCDSCLAKQDEADRRALADRHAGEIEHLRRSKLRDSKVPELPDGFVWPQSEAGAAAAAWVRREIKILTLTGPVGTGKSTLAAAALRQRLEPRPRGREIVSPRGAWRSMPSFMAGLSTNFGHPAKDDAVDLMGGHVILALDDLDKARPTEFGAENVFGLIDGCCAAGTSLIVTTNLSIRGLAEKWPEPFGDAIVSRLMSGERIVMAGTDRRLAA